MSETIMWQKYSPEFKIRLIELIQKQPLLYETPLERERFTERETAWEEIARKLNTSVADCKSAWKSLRRRYVPYLSSNSYEKRGILSNSIYSRLEFLLPFLNKENPLSPAPATSSSTEISMMNEEGLSTTPTVIKASTNSTITTDGAMSTDLLIPLVASRPEVSTTSTAPTSLSSKVSKTKKVSRSTSTTSTSRKMSTSKAGSKSTVNNISTPGTSSMDIKVNPLLFVPSYTQENNSENSDTFFVTQDIIQQLLESKEKDEKQSDFINDNKCITIDEGFIENPYNNQTTTTLSSNSCEINRNNTATDLASDTSLSLDKTDENNFLAENLTSSAQTISGEIEKQDIESTTQIEPPENNNFNIRIKNYFSCMADRMAGLPQYAQEGICLNISEIIDQARIKYLNK